MSRTDAARLCGLKLRNADRHRAEAMAAEDAGAKPIDVSWSWYLATYNVWMAFLYRRRASGAG